MAIRRFIAGLCAVAVWVAAGAMAWGAETPSVLVIVLDGLRPDYVTSDLMPNLHALGQRGTVGTRHHAAYPTVTRVNSPTIATGCYPGRHGLLGNTIFVADVDPDRTYSSGDAKNLLKIDEATNGRLLSVPSLGEVLEVVGRKPFVASSGSSGSATLLNHKFKGGGVVNVDLIRPESRRARVEELIGPAPEEGTPNAARNRWAVDAYLKYGLSEVKPDVTILWLSEPDHTAHEFGPGDPKTIESLRTVDGEIGRIVAFHRELGMEDKVNILVVSDHGFSTHTGGHSLTNVLVEHGLKAGKDSTDVVVAGDAIYVKDHDPATIAEIVRVLSTLDSVGAIFTAPASPGDHRGVVAGTLSTALIRWDHSRAADILVSPAWTSSANDKGYAGTVLTGGVAGHGSASPFDLHATFIAAGPAFNSGGTNDVPTGQIDIAPTVCALVGIEPPEHMDGRILMEILRDLPVPVADPKAEQKTWRADAGPEGYRSEAQVSTVEGRAYLDWATRVKPDPANP